MDHSKELIENGKSSAENLALKNLEKRCKDECRKLGIDLFYTKNEQGIIEYNLNSIYDYLLKLKFKDIVSYGVPVVALQIFFESKGIEIGKIDGINGPQFRAGIRDYQEQHNLAQTGRINAETLNQIKQDIKNEITAQANENNKEENEVIADTDNIQNQPEQETENNPEKETITYNYRYDAIKLEENLNYDKGVEKVLESCITRDTNKYLLQLNLTKEICDQNNSTEGGLFKEVRVLNIEPKDNDYVIKTIDVNGNKTEYLFTTLQKEQQIKGFILQSDKELPPLEDFFNTTERERNKTNYNNIDMCMAKR